MRKGFILPLTVVFIAIAAAVIMGTIYFVSNAARQTRIHLARSRCRFAAQTAIEQAKDQIWYQFYKDKIGTSNATSVKIDPKSSKIYNEWFSSYELSDEVVVNDCTVYVSVPQKYIEICEKNCSNNEHLSSGIRVIVPILATAVYTHADGLKVTATIVEYVAFGTGQSQVFDYAYFVNNYGWMNGSSITINGDMRANGDVDLRSSTVNGFIYAAINDEVGATGSVTLSRPRIYNTSNYRNSAGSRARPDTVDYDTNGAYDAPSSGGYITKTLTAASSGKTIVNEEATPIPMPYISELSSYVDYAREQRGTLTYPAVTYTDTAGTEHTINGGTVNAYHSRYEAGPSGVSTNADRGAILLVGTKANPITINGPVVIDSDVLIKGYVQGQGTIYAGRNIHIIGDINYVNAPSWSGRDNTSDESDTKKEESNTSKDMLGLMAKGNIIIGDSSDSSWHSSVDSYIKPGSGSVVNSYACDESDKNIGYPSTFAGDYTAIEKVSGLSATLAETAPGGYDSASGQFGKIRSIKTYTGTTHKEWVQYGWNRGYYQDVKDYILTDTLSYDRRYYETVCSDALMQAVKDSSGIATIDAILYNNHAIMGTPGRNGSTFNLNGCLICRDEALIFSGNGINFNWDMRLRRKTSSQMNTSLPPGPQPPFTYAWMLVPDDLNPAYTASEEARND